ncbi:MAG: NIPSNAP family protein [SAR86 cluster bacterium]|uniref:NIPSNAP family protein n=1 Tax=SAR86 cluster bacterium TaxID=2030880 RepID=A0A2A5B0J7_9GAMM|nr:MAG: NIPSNAP family protein [SAR86 cluster bacterium]
MLKKYGATVLTIALAFSAGALFQNHNIAQAQGQKVYELRTYTTLPGRLPALLKRFGGGEIDLFIKHGMTSVGYWVPDNDELSENTMVYMVAHDSREAAAASWSAFGADPEWKKMSEESQLDGRIISNVENLFLTPTNFSPVQ